MVKTNFVIILERDCFIRADMANSQYLKATFSSMSHMWDPKNCSRWAQSVTLDVTVSTAMSQDS